MKQIICGEIEEDYTGSPINIFKNALKLSKKDEWIVHTNNPQLVEALEVLCGEENIAFYIYQNNDYFRINDILELYDYLGDVYDIIRTIKFRRELSNNYNINTDDVMVMINEYEIKHQLSKDNVIYTDNLIDDCNNLVEKTKNLNRKIEELKSDIVDWKRSAEDYMNLAKGLKKENEQLKQENKELKDSLNNICNSYHNYYGMSIYEARWLE